MPPTLVLPDANIWFSRTLRDWLLLLKLRSDNQMFQVAYTVDIMAETLFELRRNHPNFQGGQLRSIHDKIIKLSDIRIEDYPSGRDFTMITDPDDRHVHAAATAGRVNCIITNDKDFTKLPGQVRDQLEYEIYTADEFFVLVDDSSPHLVRTVLQEQIDHFAKRRARGQGSIEMDFQAALAKAGCPLFGARLKAHCRYLALHG